MDFIERLLYLSPDGGTGSFELGIFIGAFVIALMTRSLFLVRRHIKER
jgi:hypothetical protein